MEYFNAFWSLYPRRVKKVYAMKCAKKIRSEEWPLVLNGLKKYIIFWKQANTEKTFIPHPSSWLNNRQWEDEIETLEEVKSESQVQVFIKAVKNKNNKSMPDFPPDIKQVFFRIGVPWNKLKEM